MIKEKTLNKFSINDYVYWIGEDMGLNINLAKITEIQGSGAEVEYCIAFEDNMEGDIQVYAWLDETDLFTLEEAMEKLLNLRGNASQELQDYY